MKPSQRIKEIAEQLVEEHKKECTTCNITHHPPTRVNMWEDAVQNYLDEEYEKRLSNKTE